jgi:hypothetical protein
MRLALALLLALPIFAGVPHWYYLLEEPPRTIPGVDPNNDGLMLFIEKPVAAASFCVEYTTVDDGVPHTYCLSVEFPDNWLPFAVTGMRFGTSADNVRVTSISVTVDGETTQQDNPMPATQYGGPVRLRVEPNR